MASQEGFTILGYPWKVVLLMTSALILLGVSLINSGADSIKQGSAMPIIKNMGERFLASEATIVKEVEYLKSNPQLVFVNPDENTTWNRIKVYGNRILAYVNILFNLWLWFLLFYLIYYAIYSFDQTNQWRAVGIAIGIVFLLEMFIGYNVLIDNVNANPRPEGFTLGEKFQMVNPLKGIVALVQNYDLLFGDLLRRIETPLEQYQNTEQSIVERRLS